MDPSDLLLTNQFISGTNERCRAIEPSLEHINNVKRNREHDELKEYLQGELNNTNFHKHETRETNLTEYDTSFDMLDPPIRNPGLTANLERPQWIFDKQNISLSSSVRPVFDKMIHDLKKFRYRKQIISYINVDSRQRDVLKYPNPGSYNIFLNKEFRYLQSIRLESIEFREAPTPINDTNNCFIWITNYTGLENVEPGTKVQYEVKIPSAFYSLANFVQTIESAAVNTIQHNIPGSSLNNKFPNFDIYISPFNRSIRFIQRAENLIVTSLKTTTNSNIVEIRIKNQGAVPPNTNCNIDSTRYPFRPDVESIPIILSGLDLFATSFGNIPVTLINLMPFFSDKFSSGDPSIFNTYSCPEVSYDTKTNEFIYHLNVFNLNGAPAFASNTSETGLIISSLPNFPAGHSVDVKVGRSLKFEVVTTCGGTFGEFLGLTTANTDVFVHANFNLTDRIVRNTIPWKVTGTGELSIATEEYILMRIGTKAKPIGTISNNLTCAKGGSVNSELANNKKDNFFFAKIIFSDKLPGDVSILSAAGNKFFYNAPLVTLSDLTVDFFDSSGRLLNLDQNHSFTLELIELREVLKDTLIDSRTGNIADVGADVATTNPI